MLIHSPLGIWNGLTSVEAACDWRSFWLHHMYIKRDTKGRETDGV